ncbi:MAG TPA: glycosyltransferase family 4 protein [Candidatus Rubrimentiphilum sp.]|nr:glycosyltransferase family 4 protein [Candidatus Rubrimentiphilum sp.]
MSKPKVAFVVPRCGAEIFGGAEVYCLELARRLGPYWDIDVLTTCARDYMTWKNEYPEGHAYEEGVRVQRFPVDRPRDVPHFNRLSERVSFDVQRSSISLQEEWMRAQGPVSTEMERYVASHRFRYDAFFFFSYLYATTYALLPLVEEKAFLVPFAHDEWPLRMRIWDEFFKRPQCLVFNTPEEHDFVRARFSRSGVDGPIIGAGVQPPAYADAESFRSRFGITEPFILYLGRIDPSKGCDVLIEDFARFRTTHAAPAKLVLIGELHLLLKKHPGVMVLGPVDDQTKWDALAACDLLAMPSAFESLSLAVLEAWSLGKAVLVNAHAAALVGQCKRSGGGLWYSNYEEFEAALAVMDEDVRKKLGRQGMDFINDSCRWESVEGAYRRLLNRSDEMADV